MLKRFPDPSFWVGGCFGPPSRWAACLRDLSLEAGAGLGSGTLSSLFNMGCLSAILDPQTLMGALRLCVQGGTVCHWLASVGTDYGCRLCSGFGCNLTGSLGFGCCCSCCPCSTAPSCVVSASCDTTSPLFSMAAVITLSFSVASCPSATPFINFAIIFVMPAPHSLFSSWWASHFCSLSCIHVIIPIHCASLRVACPCNKFVRCPTVQCSCISSCTCSRIVTSIRLLQSFGVKAVTEALLLLLRILFLFLSSGSNIVTPAISALVGVAAVVISIAKFISMSLFISASSTVSRSLLSLTLVSLMISSR